MERFDAACLTDAKKEYTQRLVRKLKTPFCEKIFSILKEVKDECTDMHAVSYTHLTLPTKA